MDFSKIKEWFIPQGKVKSVAINDKTVWQAKKEIEQLTAPAISLDGDTLTIMATDERTEEFAIFVDGVEVTTVEGEDKPEEYTVSGTWRFNDVPKPASQHIREICDFTTESGHYCRYITISDSATDLYRVSFNAGGKSGYDIDRGWDNGCQTITFDGTQNVSQEFYEWLVENAVRQEISFTINGTTYYAEDGMTWGEWVESEYNTGGWLVADTGEIYKYADGIFNGVKGASASDIIIENHKYAIEHGGGSN